MLWMTRNFSITFSWEERWFLLNNFNEFKCLSLSKSCRVKSEWLRKSDPTMEAVVYRRMDFFVLAERKWIAINENVINMSIVQIHYLRRGPRSCITSDRTCIFQLTRNNPLDVGVWTIREPFNVCNSPFRLLSRQLKFEFILQ